MLWRFTAVEFRGFSRVQGSGFSDPQVGVGNIQRLLGAQGEHTQTAAQVHVTHSLGPLAPLIRSSQHLDLGGWNPKP